MIGAVDMETVQLVRDIAIIVFAFGALLAMVLFMVMAFRLYGKVSPVLEDVRTAARNAAGISELLTTGVGKSALVILSALGAAGGAAITEFMKKRAEQSEEE